MYKNKDIKTVFKMIICNDTGTIQLAMQVWKLSNDYNKLLLCMSSDYKQMRRYKDFFLYLISSSYIFIKLLGQNRFIGNYYNQDIINVIKIVLRFNI